MTQWTIEMMVYRPRGQHRVLSAGKRISADGGKTWLEEGQVHASFGDSFSSVTREVDAKEYHSRIANPREVTMVFPPGQSVGLTPD